MALLDVGGCWAQLSRVSKHVCSWLPLALKGSAKHICRQLLEAWIGVLHTRSARNLIRPLGVTYLCATTLAALRTRRPSRQLRPSSVLPRLLFLSRCDDGLGLRACRTEAQIDSLFI